MAVSLKARVYEQKTMAESWRDWSAHGCEQDGRMHSSSLMLRHRGRHRAWYKMNDNSLILSQSGPDVQRGGEERVLQTKHW